MKNKHHYIPCSFLSAFATEDNRHGLLYTFDKKNKHIFRQTCENVGYKPRYYTVDLDDESPDYVENELAKIEGHCKPIIRQIERNRKMVTGDDYVSLMYYLGILAARVPAVRDQFNNQMDELGKLILRVSLNGKSPKDIFDFMQARGSPLESLDEARKLIDFSKSSEYRLNVHNNYQVGVVFEMAKTIAETLTRRKWTVFYKTENQDSFFVCGDAPVMLMWQSQDSVGPYPPGFALEGTEVDVPLTKNIAIVGRFEGFPAGCSIRAKSAHIRMINCLSIEHAVRFIFSYTENIPVMLPDHSKFDYSF